MCSSGASIEFSVCVGATVGVHCVCVCIVSVSVSEFPGKMTIEQHNYGPEQFAEYESLKNMRQKLETDLQKEVNIRTKYFFGGTKIFVGISKRWRGAYLVKKIWFSRYIPVHMGVVRCV